MCIIYINVMYRNRQLQIQTHVVLVNFLGTSLQIYESKEPADYRRATLSCVEKKMRMASSEMTEYLMNSSRKDKVQPREERWQPISKVTYDKWFMLNGTLFSKDIKLIFDKIKPFKTFAIFVA